MGADRVVLLRHGRTASNLEGRWQGQLDIPLDDVGTGQAKQAAEVLGEWLLSQPGELRLVSSDLSRAASTGAPLAERVGLPLALDPRLRETDAGTWQGLTGAEIEARWPQEYAAWRGGEDVVMGGAESRGQAGARAAACVEEHEAAMDGGTLVCVSHGAALRWAICSLTGLGAAGVEALEPIRNAHWTVLRKTPRGWRLGGYNLGVAASPL